jgi:hypothetical protein
VLQARLLVSAGRTGQRAEPFVDLQGVGRDGDRILAALAQQVGQGDRNRRLADGGWAEER